LGISIWYLYNIKDQSIFQIVCKTNRIKDHKKKGNTKIFETDSSRTKEDNQDDKEDKDEDNREQMLQKAQNEM